MAKEYRLGVYGLVHDHVWKELGFWRNLPQVKFVAVADPHAELCDRAVKECGAMNVYRSAEELLEKEEIDILQVCASNRDSVPAVVAALNKGIHVVSEKPMAHTLAGADAMLHAAQQSSARLAINWPIYWWPAARHAFRLVQDGAIGQVFYSCVRMSHEGPRNYGCSKYFCDWLYDAEQNGGGALIDYCSYGACISRMLFGRPQQVFAVSANLLTPDSPVEDNATIHMVYPHTFAMAEASWTSRPRYHDAIFRGTKGTLWSLEGKLFLDLEKDTHPVEQSVPALPVGQTNCPEYLLHCLETGAALQGMIDPQIARDGQEILDAGQRSAASGKSVEL